MNGGRNMKRTIVALSLVALLSIPTAGASADVKPRMPTSASDWATFSASEREAALAYVWNEFQASVRAGTAVVHTVGRSDSGALSGRVGSLAVTTTVDYNCPIQWTDLPEGTWTRGGGWTDASASVYYIAASRSGMKGQFLRDGTLISNWYSEAYNGSHAENWTGYNWKWWYEHSNFVNKGWHGARATNGGTWLLGPDRYCTVSVYR